MSFIASPIPENEESRLQAVEKTGVLDNINEDIYNVYCHLSRQITKCPESWANVIDKNRQYNFVLDGKNINDERKEELRSHPRPLTFCQYALNSPNPLIANDLTKNKIFKNHPSVLKKDGPRFYAAFPIINSEGYILGSLCVRDYRVRRLSKNIIMLMTGLAKKLSHQLDIQAEQRQMSVEKITRTIEKLNEEISNLSLDEAILVLKCLSNNLVNSKQQKKLIEIGLLDKDLKLTRKSKQLIQFLKLDAAVLKRVKMPTLKTNEIDELFKVLEK